MEVSLRGRKHTVPLPADVQDLSALASHLAQTLDQRIGQFVIISKGKKHDPQENPTKKLTDAGKQVICR